MNLGMPEMIFIFLLALIIFGPRKLPEIGRQLGRALSEFKRASNEFQAQLEEEIRQIETLEEHKAQPGTMEPGNTIHSAAVAELPASTSVPEGAIAHNAALPGDSLPPEAERELAADVARDPGLDHLTAA